MAPGVEGGQRDLGLRLAAHDPGQHPGQDLRFCDVGHRKNASVIGAAASGNGTAPLAIAVPFASAQGM